jgi:chitinase
MTMSFRSQFQWLAPQARARRRACGLAVEALEDRLTPSGVFSIGDITILEGNTGTLNALVPVTLTGAHGNNVTVEYRTTAGTATAGSDYSAVSGKLTFNKNQTSKSIVVPILGDRLIEANEKFSVQLSNSKGASIADGLGVVTIVDNEPRVGISNPTLLEGDSGEATMTFSVTLQIAYDLPVTVNYETGDGTATPGDDYTVASGTVTIAPGQTSQSIPIAVKGDRVVETDETIPVNLTTPDSYTTIINKVGVGTILDNEPHISIADAVQDYYAGYITFYVSLAVPYDQAVTVDFNTLDGTAFANVDYVPTWGTLTFNPGDTLQMITVQLLNTDPADRYLGVQLGNPSANAAIVNQWATGYWYYDTGSSW